MGEAAYVGVDRDDWVQRLPQLKSLKSLDLKVTTLRQPLFEAICQLDSLSVLKIQSYRGNLDDLKPLAQLRNLKSLTLYTANTSEGVPALGELKDLVHLTLHFTSGAGLVDLDCLKGTRLKSLALGGNSRAHAQLQSLNFLSELEDLEYLSLAGVRCSSKNSLLALQELQDFKYLYVSFPKYWGSEELNALETSGVFVFRGAEAFQ